MFSDEGRDFKVCMKCKFTMSVLKMLVIDSFTFVCVCKFESNLIFQWYDRFFPVDADNLVHLNPHTFLAID